MNIKPSHIEEIYTDPGELKDKSLNQLIKMSGLLKEYIAKQNGIHPVYLSMLINGHRDSEKIKNKVRHYLVKHVMSASAKHIARKEQKQNTGRKKRA